MVFKLLVFQFQSQLQMEDTSTNTGTEGRRVAVRISRPPSLSISAVGVASTSGSGSKDGDLLNNGENESNGHDNDIDNGKQINNSSSKSNSNINNINSIDTTTQSQCSRRPFSIRNDLVEEQRNPSVGNRWMVRPPTGGNLHLMCCETTKGSFRVLLHERWAPIGVPHLLEMMRGNYFDTEIPLFRCTDACQFGLSANKTLTKEFDRKSIPDDPAWLPIGPEHRYSNSSGKDRIKRYPKGVLTHAGGGKNSRGVQFVLTLKPNKFMGGGSPWEVPLGEVVDEFSNVNNDNNENDGVFVDVSLPDFYTGYGEKGPGQGLLHREGVSQSVREKWPLLDYVLRCSIVDQSIVDDNGKDKSETLSNNS